MKFFEFPTLRIAVEPAGAGLWRAVAEAPGAKPAQFLTGGAGPEESVAVDLIGTMRAIFRLGVRDWVKEAIERDPEMDESEARKFAAAVFLVAQAAGGDDPLRDAETEIMKGALHPALREMWERAQEVLARTYEFGDVRISVKPVTMMAPGIAGFYVRMEGPGFVDEDLIQRPDGYLLARVAWEHIQVIKRTLEWGMERSIGHFMKMNYLDESRRPAATVYITNLDRVGRALGPVRLAELEAALKAEEGKEAPERAEFSGELEERARAAMIDQLEGRLRTVEARIKELRELRERRKRGVP